MEKHSFSKRVFLLIAVFAGCFGLSVVGQDRKGGKEAPLLDSVCPVGTVLPFVGDPKSIPENWQLCNGDAIKDPKSPLMDTLKDKKVPDFVGRVPRGIQLKQTPEQTLGGTGGADKIPAHFTTKDGDGAHQHSIPPHTHKLPEMTGAIANAGPALNILQYYVKDDNGGWKQSIGDDAYHLDVSSGQNDEGQHRHILGGDTGKSTDKLTTDTAGVHKHTIDAIDYFPSYVAVHYIIRVR